MLLIGEAGGRRAALLCAALTAGGVPLTVLDWLELLKERPGGGLPADLAAGHLWCKLDPPGEEANAALIARGWALAGGIAPAPHRLRHGELAFQQEWYAGFTDLVKHLAGALAGLKLLNGPDEILLMRDKWASQQHLRERGIPVPELLDLVHSFEELDGRFPAQRFPAVFIKARHGSSAAGVLALRRHPDGRMAACTSARLSAEGVLYNHLSLSRYTRRGEITALVDALARQGAYAERWVPKPRVPGLGDACYDLRVVASCGRARQRVARISRSPMTNLHLGNQRSQPDWLPPVERDSLEAVVERAAAAFPGSRSIGFDVCLCGGQPVVLEANVFGDLLPGLAFPAGADGNTTYEDQARLVSADER